MDLKNSKLHLIVRIILSKRRRVKLHRCAFLRFVRRLFYAMKVVPCSCAVFLMNEMNSLFRLIAVPTDDGQGHWGRAASPTSCKKVNSCEDSVCKKGNSREDSVFVSHSIPRLAYAFAWELSSADKYSLESPLQRKCPPDTFVPNLWVIPGVNRWLRFPRKLCRLYRLSMRCVHSCGRSRLA